MDLVVMALYTGAALTQFAYYAFPVEAIVSEVRDKISILYIYIYF